MKRAYCLDLEGDVYSLGDLNMMFHNTETLSYPEIDPMHPTRPFITGTIEETVETGDGSRRFLIHIPKNYPISGAGLYLFPDNGVSARDCLESGWKELSEKTGCAMIILESDGSWNREDIQKEISYGETVFKRSISRVYFSLNEATYYICGLGEGAYIATAYGLLNSVIFSCILADGDFRLHEDLYAQLSRIRSDRDPLASKTDVIMPAWLVDRAGEEEGRELSGLKKAASASGEALHDAHKRIYRQDLKTYRNSLDDVPVVEVCFTGKAQAEALAEAELHEAMLEFALRFKRWLAIGNGSFRAARNWEDMGLDRREIEVDGCMREYYLSVPSEHRAYPEKKLPLVLAIHGYSATGKLFAENAEWHLLGERRGFITLYVSAYPSNRTFHGHTVPLPTWNAIGMPGDLDDIHFIETVLDSVCGEYPVDPERIYVSGHSNGSLMTQTLMERIPKRFAAFAPQGAQYHIDLLGDGMGMDREMEPDGILRPVWLMMGSDDIGDQDRIEAGNANDRFIDMMCKVNGVDRSAESYLENGKYQTRTYMDGTGMPLVKFTGIRNTPHTFTPEFAEIYWDQFLCHFRRVQDGSIIYTA